MPKKPAKSKLSPLKKAKAASPPPTTKTGHSRRWWLAAGVGVIGAGAAGMWWLFNNPYATAGITRYTSEVVNRFPHDPTAFTQGLEYYGNDIMYEGTWLSNYDHGPPSKLRKVNLQTGEDIIDPPVELGDHNNLFVQEYCRRLGIPAYRRYFGEGITLWNDRIYQLTWLNKRGFIYSQDTLVRTDEFTFDWGFLAPNQITQGWGLTHDDRHLIISDGSHTLRFINPDSLPGRAEVVRSINVTMNGNPVPNLNELEYIDGEIYANVFQASHIVRISPETGNVVGFLDISNLEELIETPTNDRDNSVPNGIAYDSDGKRLFVTGKLWNTLFEIRQVRQS